VELDTDMNPPQLTESELPPRTKAVWEELIYSGEDNNVIVHSLRDHMAQMEVELSHALTKVNTLYEEIGSLKCQIIGLL